MKTSPLLTGNGWPSTTVHGGASQNDDPLVEAVGVPGELRLRIADMNLQRQRCILK